MQRIEKERLPPDPVFPKNLSQLGYYITEDDKIRVVDSPGQGPRYRINRNGRINQAHIDALHDAIHDIIIHRLKNLTMNQVQVPKANKGPAKPSTPILVSSNIGKASRVIVFIGELTENIGVFSYREICGKGIEFGSILKLAKAVLGKDPANSPTALVLANPGGHVWQNSNNTAVTAEVFDGRARHSAVDHQRPLNLRNAIQGNGSLAQHTKYIFEDVLSTSMKVGAKIQLLGLSEGGFAAFMYLKKSWAVWAPHMSCIAIVNPEQLATVDLEPADLESPDSFFSFLLDRGRAWILSSHSLGAREAGLGTYGLNCYSSGEEFRIPCMISKALSPIICWLNLMHSIPTMKEQVHPVRGEPELDGRVIRAMQGLDTYRSYTDGDTLDVEMSESLHEFVNDVVMDDEDVKALGEQTKDATKLSDGLGYRFVDDEGFDADVESGPGNGIETDTDSVGSVETVIHDLPVSERAEKMFRGNTPSFDLKEMQDIIKDLPVSERAEKKFHGITPPFDLGDMQDIIEDLPVSEPVKKKFHGITPPFDLSDIQDIIEEPEEE